MSAPTVRFDVAIETIGEHGSPLHWIVQTVTILCSGIFVYLIKRTIFINRNGGSMLRSGIFCFSDKRLSSRTKKYERKNTADLWVSLPLVVYSIVLGVMSVF